MTESDQVGAFQCGEPSLDEYLRRHALNNHFGGGARCFVTMFTGSIAGYYTLSTASIQPAAATGRVRRNMPSPVPVVLLGRLAVDRSHQGRGVGTSLLQDALLRTIAAADQIGVRAMVVHALHEEARAFYLANGFRDSPTDSLHLMVLIKDAIAAFRPN
ncbi:MAG: GNAT family N-acetyltransferase [Propionicimonas sp.]|uniref:GNAT family N-acetyltransferase n=1 Tax=Propionicimonas sp. TaxID=1955623 RepID=UPI0025FD86E9|nr:GNAT family N-acetyltransferase [Propionicimonas sp.]MCG2803857.1 GNAT family N-acetyltransferase [Propionicimonas sp.]